MPTRQGSFRIFRLFGIDVYLHWMWFLLAVYDIQFRAHEYNSYIWNVLEYLTLFGIVLMHEFGHALACRQVGGKADMIVLWPLGGVAYVQPPERPGAMLWSIAAGPLVNVILLPLTIGPYLFMTHLGMESAGVEFLGDIALINVVLLVFNMLPFYPLDGGQILRSLLWFFVGRGTSLVVAAIVGLVGAAALGLAGIFFGSIWIALMALFMG